MKLPLRALLGSFLVLFLVGLVPSRHNVLVNADEEQDQEMPKFKPGRWKHAHATFYEGGSGTFGKNSFYDRVPCMHGGDPKRLAYY